MNHRDFNVNCVTDYYSGSTQAVCLGRVQHDLPGPAFCSEPTPGAIYQEKLRDQLLSSYDRLYPPMIPLATQHDNQAAVDDFKSDLSEVSVTALTDVLEVDESVGSNMQPPVRVGDNRSRAVGDDEASGGTGSCDADTNTERLETRPYGAVKKSKQPRRNDSGLGSSVRNSTTSTSGSNIADQGGASARLDSGVSEGASARLDPGVSEGVYGRLDSSVSEEEANGRPSAGQGNQTPPETNGGSIIGWMRKRIS